MRSILRNRRALIAMAVAALLALRLLPSPGILGPVGALPKPEAPGIAARPGTVATPTARPATLDPRKLQGHSRPFLVVRAAAVKRGAPLVVGGQSFEPFQELAITLLRKGGETVELGTATTDKDGALPDTSLSLPEGIAAGSYIVRAAPVLGGPAVEASVEVGSDQTWAKLTSTAAKPNEPVGFEGGGFQPGEGVSVRLDSLGASPFATVEASPEGLISGVARIPLAQEGDHILLFYGDQSKTPAVADLFVMGFRPWVVLDDYSPVPEHPVGFAGSDFAPGEKVFVFLNDLSSGPVATVQAGADGTFKAPGALSLGPEVKGTQTLLFVGSQSQTTAEAEFTVQPYAAGLELTIYAGPPGSEVAFIGYGFARGEEVQAYLGQPGRGEPVSAWKADEKGTFTGAGGFRVPRGTKAGDITLSVVGQVSGATASVSFSVLPISPWAESKQDQSGLAVVAGHGFAPGEAVDLMAGQNRERPLATSGADQNGNVRFAPLELPMEGTRPISLQLRGRESGGEAKTELYPGPASEGGGRPAEESGTLEFQPAGTPTPEPVE